MNDDDGWSAGGFTPNIYVHRIPHHCHFLTWGNTLQ